MTKSSEKLPDTLELTAGADLEWSEVEAAEGQPKIPKFSMTAYTGGAMRVAGFFRPVVVDLAGITAAKTIPILRGHDPDRIVGHGDVTVSASDIQISGLISGENESAREVSGSSKNGFPWQASVGLSVEEFEGFKEGESVKVNGQTIAGPVLVARKSTLNESSFVPLGADRRTSAKVAASSAGTGAKTMQLTKGTTFSQWLTAEEWDEEALSDKQKSRLKAQFDSEIEALDGGARGDESFEEMVAKNKREQARKKRITQIVSQAIDERRGTINETEDSDKIERLGRAALNGSTSPETFELELLRAMRPNGPVNIIGSSLQAGSEMSPKVIEAAICQSLRLQNIEDHYDERTLEAADRHYRHGIGLQEFLLLGARQNGYSRISVNNLRSVLRAAFPPQEVRASGFSTISVPGITSNVMNKFLVDHFNFVENVWRQIAAIRPVNDFKQTTSYSLTGDLQYEEIGPAGEIKHGEVAEETYSNQARTYAKMLGLTRTDIINDDLGAFQSLPRRLGRGAALKINDVFWTAFMDNASFFTAGRGNFDDGSDTALSIDALTLAEALFLDQTDPDGKPMSIVPRFLLTPNALSAKAAALMNSTELRDTTANTVFGVSNPHAGKFTPIRSSYLSNAAYTGNSALAWYLLADPNDVPVIELVFLNGREMPIVETADADFDTLGIQIRGYHDFGAAKQEYRGGVKMKGEA